MLGSVLTEHGGVVPGKSAGKKTPHQAWNQHDSLPSALPTAWACMTAPSQALR